MVAVVASKAASLKTFTEVPPGFMEYTVQENDTWDSVTNSGREKLLAMQVNRMNVNLKKGNKILLPISSRAYVFAPVPESIRSSGRHLIIFKLEQYFGAYEDGVLVRWGPVSTGKKGRDTPNGTYSALWKDKFHRSSLYSNARMYFAVQFKGNYFTHEQALPGYPASHGCVRMLWEDAEWKFDWIRVGDTVSVVSSIAKVGV